MESRFTIMIVDDDDDDRAIFCDVIHQLYPEAACLQLENGCKALEFLHNNKNRQPDVLFLDLNMPKLNGKQCLIEIKKSNFLSKIPVVIYTTSKLPKDEDELTALGATNFLTKPAKSKDLVMEVSEIIEGITNNLGVNQR